MDLEGFRADLAWLSAGAVADMVSTRYMLGSCAECFEANPWMRRHPEVKKALSTAVVLGGLHWLRSKGHDRLATWLRWGIFAGLMVVSGWNVYLGRGG